MSKMFMFLALLKIFFPRVSNFIENCSFSIGRKKNKVCKVFNFRKQNLKGNFFSRIIVLQCGSNVNLTSGWDFQGLSSLIVTYRHSQSSFLNSHCFRWLSLIVTKDRHWLSFMIVISYRCGWQLGMTIAENQEWQSMTMKVTMMKIVNSHCCDRDVPNYLLQREK